MKKFKISLSVIAFAFAIGLSAFTIPETKVTDAWFQINDLSHKDDPASYTYTGTSSPCPSGSLTLCAIRGTRDVAPNTNRPTPASLAAAKTASSNWTAEAAGQVDFKNP